MSPDRRRSSRALLAASVILFVASLTQNGFCLLTGGAERCDNYGIAVLGLGWMETLFIGDVGPFVALSWFANPCLVFSWAFLLGTGRRVALVLTGLATALSLAFLLGNSVQISEGGGPSPITSHGAGYWLWLGSIVLALASALLMPGIRRAPA